MKTIFLDLEETIIESIDSPKILSKNISEIKKFIDPNDKIVIFSFALWEKNDLTQFVSDLIFSEFGSFEVVWKMDLFPLFQEKFGIKDLLDFMDFSSNKEFVFVTFIIEEILKGNVGDCIFFDDRIRSFEMSVMNKSVKLVNVKEWSE